MASATSFASGVGLPLPQSVSSKWCNKAAIFALPHLSLSFHARPGSFRALTSRQLSQNGAFRTGLRRNSRSSRPFLLCAAMLQLEGYCIFSFSHVVYLNGLLGFCNFAVKIMYMTGFW
ncbi:hypothetical protein GBA52_028630 [Prunus armeniaca]|nr:hypothetical protein GBA52_028630 [Prunus armeniaca]